MSATVVALCVGLVAVLVGFTLAVGAGVLAAMRHLPSDPRRNAKRYVAPAMIGFLVFGLGLATVVVASLVAVIEAAT